MTKIQNLHYMIIFSLSHFLMLISLLGKRKFHQQEEMFMILNLLIKIIKLSIIKPNKLGTTVKNK